MDKRNDINGNHDAQALPFAQWYKQAANTPSFSARHWPSRKWDGSESAFLNLQKDLEKNGEAAANDVSKDKKKQSTPQLETRKDIEALVSDLQSYIDIKKKSATSMDSAIALVEYIQHLVDDSNTVIEQQESRIRILERFNITDLTTGLFNKTGFVRIFEKELDRCRRGKCEGGLLVNVDIDNFEQIISAYGQKVADLCLQKVARTIQNQIRMMDVAARLSDDEFVVLMTNTNKYEASDRAQDLAWQLGHLSLSFNGKDIPIWASLGLKTYAKGDMVDSLLPEQSFPSNQKEDEHA